MHRKSITLLFFLFVFCLSVDGQYYAHLRGDTAAGASTLLDSLIAYYAFENTSGTVRDSSGNGHHGTNNGCTRGSTGKIGNCFTFTASESDYVSVSDNADFDPGGAFTMSVWINIAANSGNTVVAVRDHASYKYMLYRSNNSNNIRAFVNPATSAPFATTDFDVGTDWVHIVMTFDRTLGSNRLKLYVNNVEERTATGVDEDVADGSADFMIGRRNTTYFDGTIDELGFWNRVLTTSEISELYNSGSGETPFD